MCGIAGGISIRGAPFMAAAVTRADQLLAHRGPDGRGFAWLDHAGGVRIADAPPTEPAHVLLVHRRLAIIDLSPRGAQPKHSASSGLTLVFNGEIYNYRELRDELRDQGATFTSESDTEVLLAAWHAYGPECLSRLEGMFAFAMLDSVRRELHLVRDYFGIKPLFLWRSRERLAFASEIPPLLALAGARPRLRDDRVFPFLRYGQTDEGDATLLDGVTQLGAGTRMVVPLDRPDAGDTHVFWRVEKHTTRRPSFSDAVSETRERFLRSVELHLRADVPVGACLSGGIDSSAVVCAARHILGPSAELHVFTFGSDDTYDETAWARMAAERSQATHHCTSPDSDALVADIDRLISEQGEPFASTSIFAQARVFDLIRQVGLKVVLDGQGADEMLAGYANAAGARVADLVRSGRVMRGTKLLRALRGDGGAGPAGRWLAAQYLLPQMVQAPLRRLLRKETVPSWLSAPWVAVHVREMPQNYTAERSDLMKAELRYNLSGSLRALLRYEDRNSMRNGIEARVPFLSRSLADHFLSLPDDFLLGDDGETKRVFRAAMRGIVPDPILDRRDKIGFRAPEARWLVARRDWVERSLFGDRARALPFLDQSGLAREWNHVIARPTHYNPWLWRCINLVRWLEIFDIEFDER